MKRRVVMDRVFAEGNAAKGYPLVARYASVPPEGQALTRVAFTVGKRRFKRAVDRNLIKRLMREAWRHHRHLVENDLSAGVQWAVVLIFVGKDLPSAEEVERGMVKLLKRMSPGAAHSES